MTNILVILVSYLIGAIPCGLLIGQMYGVDVRKVGSKNIGATNVTRTVGKTQGKICFFLDFLKGALPVILALQCGLLPLFVLMTGFAAIAGHMFPVYLGFKGGKGVSTAAGAALALAPLPLLTALVVWVVVFFASRYVSLASIAAAASLPVLAIVFAWSKVGSVTARSCPTLIFLILIAVLAIIRHHANIRRLLNGTENRFNKSVPKAEKQIK